MTSAGPWSVKGIDPKAREIAKDLARRSGMTLGEWLNQMIIEGGESDAPPPYETSYRPSDSSYRPSDRRSALDDYLREPRRSHVSEPHRPVSESRRPPEPPRFDYRGEDELARIARALEALSARIEAAEHRSTLAISGIDQSVIGLLSRLDGIEREQGADTGQLRDAIDEVREAQARMADRVRRFADEDSSRAEALRSLEDALARLAGQIHESEDRARAASDQVRDDMEALGRRVNNVEGSVEAAQGRFADAEMVETVLSRMAERIERAEARTNAAARSLETSFAGLDSRLKSAEGRLSAQAASAPEMQRQFQTLAAELSQKVEESRVELSQRLREAAGGRIDAMESALKALTGQVQKVEQSSAEAIERMGREVTRIAHDLGDRVGAAESRAAKAVEQIGGEVARVAEAVETRTADAVKQMGGEMARIAEAMETRMRRADSVQAEALEKLGAEIARIAERLSERVSSAERRSAQVVDEVTNKVVKIGDKLTERQEKASSELAERIRQSEERTAKLLEDARGRLDQQLAELQRKAAVEKAVQSIEAAPASPPRPAPPPVAPPVSEPVLAVATAPAAEPPLVRAPEPPQPAPAEMAMIDDDPFAHRAPAAFQPDPSTSLFDPSDDFEPVAPPAAPEPPPLSIRDFAPQPAELAPGQMSTREMIEQARAAARKAAGARVEASTAAAPPPSPEAAEGPKPFGISFPKRRRKEAAAPTLRTVILASGVATGITMAAMGTALLYNPADHDRDSKAPEAKGGQALARADLTPSAAPKAIRNGGEDDGLAASEPTLAVAFAPSLSGAPQSALATTHAPEPAAQIAGRDRRATAAAAVAPAAAKPAVSPADLYAKAASRIDSGDISAIADLRRTANLGYAPAEFYLAKLYEAGGAGLTKDLAEARRWTERAAKSGDPNAMYNLASYLYEGDGGPRDVSLAADWFRRAAELGVVNSQYNIAQLYEKGYGVPQNEAEALKWYLVAAAAGDPEAKQKAEALRHDLTPEAQAAAARNAAAVRSQMAMTGRTSVPTTPAAAR